MGKNNQNIQNNENNENKENIKNTKKKQSSKHTVEQDEFEDENLKLSRKETLNKKYSYVTGESKDFIINILNRVDKAPRIRPVFERIINKINAKRAEQSDPQLDKLEKQLVAFVGKPLPTNSQIANADRFLNYDEKFTFSP